MANIQKNALNKLLTTVNETSSHLNSIQSLENKEPAPDIPKYSKKLIQVPYAKLQPHAQNKYPINDINKIMALLLDAGLIEPLSGIYLMEKDKYIIESGERRYTGIGTLFEKYENNPDDSPEYKKYMKYIHPFYISGVPFLLEKDTDIIHSEARLIIANEGKRSDDPVRSAQCTARLVELRKLENQTLNKDMQLSPQKTVAQELGISDRQVRTHVAVASLLPELQEEISIRRISLEDGAKYAKLDSVTQKFLVELLRTNPEGETKYSTEEILEIKERADKLQHKLNEKENENCSLKQQALETSSKKKLLEEQLFKLQEEINLKKSEPDQKTLDTLEKYKSSLSNAIKRESGFSSLLEKEAKEKEKLQQELNALKEKPVQTADLTVQDRELLTLTVQLDNTLNALEKESKKLEKQFKTYKQQLTPEKENALKLNTVQFYQEQINALKKKLQFLSV